MRYIVMTGGTSGLGAIAVKQLSESPEAVVILCARGARPRYARTRPLDLTRLADVRTFAGTVSTEVGSDGIDALVLNAGAGVQHVEGRTIDGFETTFAVNHLAHYLLLRLLLPRLTRGAVVVMTTSGTHDPAEGTVIPPPRHADAGLLAYPEKDPSRDRSPRVAGGRAYSSSKLCVILTARALASHSETRDRALTVVAYDPGPTPGTGLMTSAPPLVRFGWRRLTVPLRIIFRGSNTLEDAGGTLAAIALRQLRPPDGRLYAALRRGQVTWPSPSTLACRDDLMGALWRDSAALVGLPE
jgi:NAD(P)-dependent dehydrogenase (short-subunit alcohol dehydrogenase family)